MFVLSQVDRHIQQTMFSADQKGSKSGDEKSHFIRFAAHLAILLDSLLPTDSVMHIDLGAQQNAVNNLVQVRSALHRWREFD
jgi:hypothetical protein